MDEAPFRPLNLKGLQSRKLVVFEGEIKGGVRHMWGLDFGFGGPRGAFNCPGAHPWRMFTLPLVPWNALVTEGGGD